jgi:hypothetical protein
MNYGQYMCMCWIIFSRREIFPIFIEKTIEIPFIQRVSRTNNKQERSLHGRKLNTTTGKTTTAYQQTTMESQKSSNLGSIRQQTLIQLIVFKRKIP